VVVERSRRGGAGPRGASRRQGRVSIEDIDPPGRAGFSTCGGGSRSVAAADRRRAEAVRVPGARRPDTRLHGERAARRRAREPGPVRGDHAGAVVPRVGRGGNASSGRSTTR
jgi:hypothetical protein